MQNYSKSWWESKTVIASLLVVLLNTLNFNIEGSTQAIIVDTLINIGGLASAYARYSATHILTK
jgi:hypothetical protein